jgi:hypothetical protein
MRSTMQPTRRGSFTLFGAVALAMLGGWRQVANPPGASRTDERSDAKRQIQWIPDIQKEWERLGSKEFQPVPADQPHAIFVFKDVAARTGVGAFEIWLLVDGKRVNDWTASSPLRVSPGAHCLRIDMVSISQRYQGTLGKYWPWLAAGWEHTVQLTREGTGAFRIAYQPTKFGLTGILDEEKVKYERDRPADPEAAYEYCLRHVNEKRPE